MVVVVVIVVVVVVTVLDQLQCHLNYNPLAKKKTNKEITTTIMTS